MHLQEKAKDEEAGQSDAGTKAESSREGAHTPSPRSDYGTDPGEDEESEGEMAAKARAGELFHLYHARLKEYRDLQSQLAELKSKLGNAAR